MTDGFSFDVASTFAGLLVLASFLMIHQVRLPALINMLGVQACILALALAWRAHIRNAPELYVAAAITLGFKAVAIPMALRRIVLRLGLHREIEAVTGVGPSMLAGIGLVALSLEVMLPVTAHADPLMREDIALALSVVLLGLLMMVTRRGAVSQVAAFLSLENGIDLAAAAVQGTPLVLGISVALPVLIAVLLIGAALFRIRERFDPADVRMLGEFRGDRE